MGFMMQIRPEVLKKLREDYPPGAKVERIEMCDPYRDMPAGMHGEVMFVDDAGGVHIAWANRHLCQPDRRDTTKRGLPTRSLLKRC